MTCQSDGSHEISKSKNGLWLRKTLPKTRRKTGEVDKFDIRESIIGRMMENWPTLVGGATSKHKFPMHTEMGRL